MLRTGKTLGATFVGPKSTDTMIRNVSGDGVTPNEPFVGGDSCPMAVHGDVAMVDQHAAPNTFLANAIEILEEQSVVGDNAGLCESGEACIYSPNFGAYQGHGDYLSNGTCNFVDGAGVNKVTGVTMYANATNGY